MQGSEKPGQEAVKNMSVLEFSLEQTFRTVFIFTWLGLMCQVSPALMVRRLPGMSMFP